MRDIGVGAGVVLGLAFIIAGGAGSLAAGEYFRPVDRPRPVEKTADPATVAGSTSATGTAGAAVGGENGEEVPLTAEDIPLAIAKAKVGDWALYKTADGGTSRLTVVESFTDLRGDRQLIVKVETKPPGKKKARTLEEEVSVKERVADLRDLGEEDYLGRAEILVKGKKLGVVVVNYCEQGILKRQSYLSGEVPVYGIVRGLLHEGNKRTVALSLEDFGFGE